MTLVLEYFPHNEFINYYKRFDAWKLKNYLQQILMVLSKIHSKSIIHGDIKP